MLGWVAALIPDVHDLLSLEPAELAGILLSRFNATDTSGISRHNTVVDPDLVEGYPLDRHEAVREAFMEAWVWLEREGFLAPKPGAFNEGWVFVTRRGRRMKQASDLETYKKASLLPKELLHPVIVAKTYATFLRGDYDTAIFQAFKEVEVAVRNAAHYGPDQYGVPLMRSAFSPDSGPLRGDNLVDSEQEAMSHLFAGAIGLYKNAHSHRNLAITDPIETIEYLMLASHLMRIVDFYGP